MATLLINLLALEFGQPAAIEPFARKPSVSITVQLKCAPMTCMPVRTRPDLCGWK